MKRNIAIDPKIALSNIESSMRAEGFRVSEKTKAACSIVASGRKSASELIDAHVKSYTGREK